jgi:hypothetical protein
VLQTVVVARAGLASDVNLAEFLDHRRHSVLEQEFLLLQVFQIELIDRELSSVSILDSRFQSGVLVEETAKLLAFHQQHVDSILIEFEHRTSFSLEENIE